MFFWFLYLHLEFVFFFFLRRLWRTSAQKKERVVTLKENNIPRLSGCIFFLYVLFLVTTKNPGNSALFGYIFLYTILLGFWFYILNIFAKHSSTKTFFLFFILENLFFIFISFYYVSNLIEYLFLIELVSIFYYFFFLNAIYDKNNISLIQSKQALLLYLWNSFLTTFFIGIGAILLVYTYGTLDFNELNTVFDAKGVVPFHFVFVGMAWKLGLPGFQFFKLEIYKYLDGLSVFLFSGVTLLVNLFMFSFLFLQPFLLVYFSQTYWHVFLILAFFFLYFFFNVTKIHTFLAFSGFITATTLILCLVC